MTTSMQFILWQILNTKCVVLNYGPHAPFILGNFSIAAFAHNCTLCLCVCVVDRADKQAGGWRWKNTNASDY